MVKHTSRPEEEYMDMKPLYARIPIRSALALLLVAVTSGCGVSKSQYLTVTQGRDSLAAVNRQLENNLAAANQEKAQLETRAQSAETKSQQLEAQLAEATQTVEGTKSTYDALVSRLQGEVSSGKVQIEQMREGVNVNLAQDILFKSGSADLDKEGRELLLKVAEDLKASPFQVQVIGHTDNQKIGKGLASKYPTNWELGSARSARIVRLFDEAGIPKERMAAISASDSRPRESNDTPEGRAKNRRIEIRLRPVAEEHTASE
jgi:chemotaxis protein MotB